MLWRLVNFSLSPSSRVELVVIVVVVVEASRRRSNVLAA